MILSGTHGTTQANAERIQATGFHDSKGRSGTGVYLWAVYDGYFHVPLAIAWTRYSLASANYLNQRTQTSQSIRVIHCSITLGPDVEFLDLETCEMKTMLIEVAVKLHMLQSERKEDLCRCVDFLVGQVEKITGVPIVVLQARVAAPKPEFFRKEKYPIRLIGAPMSYIVRNPSRIQVVRVDEVNE